MLEVEGLTLAPLESVQKTLDAVLPVIGALSQVPTLLPGLRDFSRLSSGSQTEARNQWD